MRALIRRALGHLGCAQIFEARDPLEALPIARAESVHLIVSDYDMPRMNGLQFAAVVCEDSALSGVGFVLISGVAGTSVVAEAAKQGVHSFIRKPFSLDELRHQIGGVLQHLTGYPVDWRASA